MSNVSKVTIIEDRIFIIRDQQVMIARDLAELYNVETKALNQAVKRNIEKFPEDYLFVVNADQQQKVTFLC